MGRHILLTGATGALGPHLVAELLQAGPADRLYFLIRPAAESIERRFASLVERVREVVHRDIDRERLCPVAGDLRLADLGMAPAQRRALSRTTQVVIHAAADTRFRAPAELQHQTNVAGTHRLLDWARGCLRLQQVVLVSTTCVAGSRTGRISEVLFAAPADFTNPYEQTKWQAELLAHASRLPLRVLRLSTVMGSQRTGAVYRPGALHHALRWLSRGLVPMVPGDRRSPVDMISSETAALLVARAAAEPPREFAIYHVAAGQRALPLGDLLDFATEQFKLRLEAWHHGQIDRALIVDKATFKLFCQTVRQSQDVLFGQVLESINSFLPALQHPKIYDTARAEALWGAPLPMQDPRETLERVIDFCLRTWPVPFPAPHRGNGREGSVPVAETCPA